jgi:electron transport complex protein RnfD
MTAWLPPLQLNDQALTFTQTLTAIFTGALPAGINLDTLTMATPLDALRTQLGLDQTVAEIRKANAVFSGLSGIGWEWINAAFLAGGVWLIFKKVINWQIPAGMIGGIGLMAAIFHFFSPDAYASPMFHIFGGATMLGAFFIATDPVSAATTPLGRIIYGAGIGILVFTIRTWGGYPDAVAFAVLLMNMVVPTIDYYSQPRVVGHRQD